VNVCFLIVLSFFTITLRIIADIHYIIIHFYYFVLKRYFLWHCIFSIYYHLCYGKEMILANCSCYLADIFIIVVLMVGNNL